MSRALGALVIALVALVCVAPAPGAPPRPPNLPGPGGDPRELVLILEAPEAAPGVRDDAARKLLTMIDRGAALSAAQDLLRSGRVPAARRALAQAISEMTRPPRELLQALAQAIDPENDPDGAVLVLRALAGYRSKEAVRAVLDGPLAAGRPALPAAVESAAFESLLAQTGLADLDRDPARWRAWWAQAQRLPEGEWRAALLDAQAAHARSLRAERDAGLAQLVELYKRLNALTPEPARSDLLVELVSSASPALRRLGFDLATRDLLNAKVLAPAVMRAVADRLSDPVPALRASAASILQRQHAPELIGRLEAALTLERDPHAASAMLLAASRYPSPALLAPALRWVDADPGARGPAVEALLACAGAGLLAGGPEREMAIASLLSGPVSALPVPGLRLLVLLGQDAMVAPELESPERERALAAAEALIDRAGALGPLLEAAQRDGAFEGAALRALAAHDPTAMGYQRGAALSRRAESSAALTDLARALPPAELLRVATSLGGARELDERLGPVLDAEFFAHDDAAPQRAQLGALLARARLGLGQPERALEVLERVPPGPGGPEAAAARVTALLCLNRVDEAEAIASAPAIESEAWLDGLELSLNRPWASSLRDRIAARFDGRLSPEQAERFSRLSAMVPAPQSGPPAP